MFNAKQFHQFTDSKWLNFSNSVPSAKNKKKSNCYWPKNPIPAESSFIEYMHTCIHNDVRSNRFNGINGWIDGWLVWIEKRFNIPIHRLNRITANLWHHFVNLLAWCGGLSISHIPQIPTYSNWTIYKSILIIEFLLAKSFERIYYFRYRP